MVINAWFLIPICLSAISFGLGLGNVIWTFHVFPSEKKSKEERNEKRSKGNGDRKDRNDL